MVHIKDVTSRSINEELVFLIGAGASRDADIPISKEMIAKLEEELASDNEADDSFSEIYQYAHGAIVFAKGCRNSTLEPTINIEDIMRTLALLQNRQNEDLYPFVGSWHEKILKFESLDSECFGKLTRFIENQLIKWVNIKDNEIKANYLQGFGKLVQDTGAKVRIFTLNYDLALETALESYSACRTQVGFDTENRWNKDLYDEPDVDINIYKLHGSVDWYESNGLCIRSDEPKEKRLLIFGTDNKLQSIDPFLSMIYQFREYASKAKVLIVIGYSFGDQYINKIIFQALQTDASKKLLIIDTNAEGLRKNISNICLDEMDFELSDSKIIVESQSTEKLFKENLLKPLLEKTYSDIQKETPF